MRHGISGFSTGVAMVMVLFMVAAVGVGWVYSGMVAQDRWPIRWLDVDGTFERVSAEQVRASLLPLAEGSFFTVDTPGMKETIAAMPWVASVAVQKSWPDTILVTVREYTPVAHWIDGYLLDGAGQPFLVPGADDIQGLPWLDAPEGHLELVFENWRKFDDELAAIGQQVERLTLDARGSWSARLSGGTEVKFGKGEIFKNLDTLVSTWAELMQDKVIPPVSVDLRYTNGFAVLWPENVDAVAGNYGKKG